jgi:hypothetical protein
VMPPRPKTVPPASKSSLITSFFSRIDQPRDRFSAVRPSVRALAEERDHAALRLDHRRTAASTIGSSTSRVPPPAYDSVPASSNNDQTLNDFLQEIMEDQALEDDMPMIASKKKAINNDDDDPSEPLAPVAQRDPLKEIYDQEEDDDEARSNSEPHDRSSRTLFGMDTTTRAAGTSVRNRHEPEAASLRELDNQSKRQRTSGSSTSTFSTANPAQRIESNKNLFRSSRNIVHQLACRSFIGSSRHHFSSVIRCDKRMRHYRHWKIASKLRIPVRTATASNNMNATNVLAFDRDGSLLAVAHGRAEVSVYDWQSMRLTTRRTTKVGGHSSDLAECLPMLQFKVGPFSVPIALLAWNPFNEDEIVIGLR